MKRGIIITIDGPSGAGKGTLARAIAKRLGYSYMDTGAMYRVIALLVHRKNVNIDDEKRLSEMLLQTHISFERDQNSNLRVFLNREDVTEEIRAPEISKLSSDVATKKVVRDYLRGMQRRIALKGNIVTEGRDMGTYVFPNADFKFYIDASLSERARRRRIQLKESGIKVSIEEVKSDIEGRDKQDKERLESPLHPAPDAVIIDTTNLTVDKAEEDVYSLGPIIHNPQVVRHLEEKGVKVIDKFEDAPGGTVMIRAHGVPLGTLSAAKERGLNVIDLTCPIVKKLQRSVKKLAEEGYFIVIVGDKKHPEIIGARSYADPENVMVVDSKSELEDQVFLKKRVGIVAQTTIAFDRFREVVEEFLQRSVEEIKIFNTICDDIFNKQREAVEIAKSVDVMIVIGGKNSSNTTKIAKLCHEVNPNTYQIETADTRCRTPTVRGRPPSGQRPAAARAWASIEEILSGLEKT